MPVFTVALAGYIIARAGLISGEGLTGFSNVTFCLFVPAQLFRAMRTIRLDTFDARSIVAYFGCALLVFMIVWWASRKWQRRGDKHATVTALSLVFSNTLLLGIPLIKLAYGDSGLVILLTIITFHTLILYSTATLFLEFSAEGRAAGTPEKPRWRQFWEPLRNTLMSPIIYPIVLGVIWGAFDLPLPGQIDGPLALIATAASPCSLVLLGASLSQYGIVQHWRPALALALLKITCFPLVMWVIAEFVFRLEPLAVGVVTLTAALPTGANVFLFAQRYQVAQGETTAAVAMSSMLSVITLAAVMLILG